jgi:hypothetical protein
VTEIEDVPLAVYRSTHPRRFTPGNILACE